MFPVTTLQWQPGAPAGLEEAGRGVVTSWAQVGPGGPEQMAVEALPAQPALSPLSHWMCTRTADVTAAPPVPVYKPSHANPAQGALDWAPVTAQGRGLLPPLTHLPVLEVSALAPESLRRQPHLADMLLFSFWDIQLRLCSHGNEVSERAGASSAFLYLHPEFETSSDHPLPPSLQLSFIHLAPPFSTTAGTAKTCY